MGNDESRYLRDRIDEQDNTINSLRRELNMNSEGASRPVQPVDPLGYFRSRQNSLERPFQASVKRIRETTEKKPSSDILGKVLPEYPQFGQVTNCNRLDTWLFRNSGAMLEEGSAPTKDGKYPEILSVPFLLPDWLGGWVMQAGRTSNRNEVFLRLLNVSFNKLCDPPININLRIDSSDEMQLISLDHKNQWMYLWDIGTCTTFELIFKQSI